MEDLTGKAPAPGGPETQLTSPEWNNFVQELKNLITPHVAMSVGDLQQINKVISTLIHRVQFYSDSGAVNAHVLGAFAGLPTVLAYAEGVSVKFRPIADNTTNAPTVNVAGLGARVVTREDGSVLQPGDLSTTRDALLRYNNSSSTFRLSNGSLGAPQQALPVAYIKGLTMGRNPADLVSDVSVQPGSCRDEANLANMSIASIFTKRFDAAVAEGSGVGGYPATALGARQADTLYRFFLVRNADGTIDGGWDSVANADAAGLLSDLNAVRAGWSGYRQIGWSKTGSVTTELLRMANTPNSPNVFQYIDAPTFEAAAVSAPSVRTSVTLPLVPPDAVANLHVYLDNTSSNNLITTRGIITDKEETSDILPSDTAYTIRHEFAPGREDLIAVLKIAVDSAQAIWTRFTSSNGTPRVRYSTPSFRWER